MKKRIMRNKNGTFQITVDELTHEEAAAILEWLLKPKPQPEPDAK